MQRPRLVSIGDNVVDCYVDLGSMYPGGNAVNVAVHAARLGAHSAYIGTFGTDEAGRCVRESLLAEGVDVSAAEVVEGPNARAIVRVVDGNRVFGAGSVGVSRFVPTTDQLAVLQGAELVHTGDCSMLEEHLGRIRDHVSVLSYDFSEQPWEYVAEHAPLVDIAICSLPSEDSAEDRARAVASLGPRTVVVTRGAAGATVLSPSGIHHATAGTGPVVDTLGAGDALAACFLLGLLRREPPTAALDTAARYATQTCAEYGAFGHPTPLPTSLDPTAADEASTNEGATP